MDELVCIEFSTLGGIRDQLIGAADVPAEGWKAAASALGRALCRVWSLGAISARVLDQEGNEIKTLTIQRGSR